MCQDFIVLFLVEVILGIHEDHTTLIMEIMADDLLLLKLLLWK